MGDRACSGERDFGRIMAQTEGLSVEATQHHLHHIGDRPQGLASCPFNFHKFSLLALGKACGMGSCHVFVS
jgi:hypothetical protein